MATRRIRAALVGQQHAGQQGPGVVGRGRPDHLAQALGQQRPREADRPGPRRRDGRELHHRVGPKPEARPGRRDLDLVVPALDRHRPGLEGPHDVGSQSGRDDRRPVVEPDDLELDPDGQVKVGAGGRELVPLAHHQQARRGRRTTAPRPPTARPGGGQGLDQRVAFRAELHRVLSSDRRSPQTTSVVRELNSSVAVIGAGDCGCPSALPARGRFCRPPGLGRTAGGVERDPPGRSGPGDRGTWVPRIRAGCPQRGHPVIPTQPDLSSSSSSVTCS